MRPCGAGRFEGMDDARIRNSLREKFPVIESGDDFDPGCCRGGDDSVSLGPIELALAGTFDLAPLEERLLPTKAGALHDVQIALRGGRIVPDEDVHPVFRAC